MAEASHLNDNKSFDSGLAARGGSEYQGPAGMSHEVQQGHHQAANLLSSSVMTLSGANDVENRFGERSSHAPSSGVEEADSIKVPVETHDPLHVKALTLQCNTGLLEPAGKLSGQCTLASFSSDGDPVSPNDGNPSVVSPMLSAQERAAPFSFDACSSACVGEATAVCTPEKERRLIDHKAEIVSVKHDSSVQSQTRMYFERIVLEKDCTIAELQSTVSELEELCNEAVLAKEKVEHKLLIVEQLRSTDKAGICRLENELERFSECVADVEKRSQEEKERYEAEIEELQKMGRNRHAVEREIIELEILEHLKAIEVGEERSRRLQTELNLAFLKRDNAVLKAERDAACAERDFVKAELERLKSCQ